MNLSASGSIVGAESLLFSYDNQQEPALSGLTLQVEEGSFTAIIGSNGSGKSTFAKMISVLLRPTEGELNVCWLNARDEANTIAIRRNVGMVFQNPDNQIVATVVEEDVAFGPENLGVPAPQIRERVDAALRDVGMSGYGLKQPHMLSGGQKQRVAIAGALAMQPRVLVLDEATAMLDPIGRREVSRTVERLRETYNMTVIWITHHMNEATLAERVVVINAGKVAMEGPPREIFADAKTLGEIGLVAADQTRLANMLREDGMDIGVALTVQELAEQVAAALSE